MFEKRTKTRNIISQEILAPISLTAVDQIHRGKQRELIPRGCKVPIELSSSLRERSIRDNESLPFIADAIARSAKNANVKDFGRRFAGSKDDRGAHARKKSRHFCVYVHVRVTSWWRRYACEWRHGAASGITIITIKWPRRERRMEWPCSRGREPAHLWITVTTCQFTQARATASGQASAFRSAFVECIWGACIREGHGKRLFRQVKTRKSRHFKEIGNLYDSPRNWLSTFNPISATFRFTESRTTRHRAAGNKSCFSHSRKGKDWNYVNQNSTITRFVSWIHSTLLENVLRKWTQSHPSCE